MRNKSFLYVRRLGLLLLALLGLLLFRARPARAQQVYLRQFGPTEGFQPPFVYALLQDRQGYLWLGTADGLVRYDGAHFVTFTKKDGLAEDFVVSLREEPANGRLWVGHYQGGISVKKTAAGPFTPAARAAVPATLRLPADGPPPVDTAAIGRYLRHYHLRLPAGTAPTCLLQDREGNAWMGTAGQGLWRHSDQFLRLDELPDGPLGQIPALATVAKKDHAEAWGTYGGNSFFQLRPHHFTPYSAGSPLVPPLPGEPVKVLLPRSGGGFWVGTSTGLYTKSNPKVLPQTVPGLSNNRNFDVTALAYAPGSGLWMGTAADGLYLGVWPHRSQA